MANQRVQAVKDFLSRMYAPVPESDEQLQYNARFSSLFPGASEEIQRRQNIPTEPAMPGYTPYPEQTAGDLGVWSQVQNETPAPENSAAAWRALAQSGQASVEPPPVMGPPIPPPTFSRDISSNSGGGNSGDSRKKKALMSLKDMLTKQQLMDINSQDRLALQLAGAPVQLDLSPLMQLSDTWFGGNLAKGYKRPTDLRTSVSDQSKMAEITRKGRADLVRQQALGDLKNQLKQQESDRRQQRFLDDRVSKLSRDLEKSGLAELDQVISNINLTVPSKGDIPGAGQTGALPDVVLSTPGKEVRQAVASLRNIILKARSGAAVTPYEAKRMLEEIGIGATRSDEQLRIGLRNVANQLAAKKNNILSGYSKEILDEYSSRGGNISLPKFGANQAALQRPPQIPQDAWDAATPEQRKEAVEKLNAR